MGLPAGFHRLGFGGWQRNRIDLCAGVAGGPVAGRSRGNAAAPWTGFNRLGGVYIADQANTYLFRYRIGE